MDSGRPLGRHTSRGSESVRLDRRRTSYRSVLSVRCRAERGRGSDQVKDGIIGDPRRCSSASFASRRQFLQD